MQISGNTLPVLTGFVDQNPSHKLADRRQSLVEQYQDTEGQTRQQTVEFVLRGELVDDVLFDEQNRQQNAQQIDPANREAISSYIDVDTASLDRPERHGRLLDLFI